MTNRKVSAGKMAALVLAVAAAVALPMSASARGHGGYHGGHGYHGGGYHGGYHGYHGGYYGGGGYYRHGGHWSGGRWIAGALVAGAVVGLVDNALSPREYYQPSVVYTQPRTVVYEDGPPVVTRQVVETRTVTYDDPYQTRYVGSDGN